MPYNAKTGKKMPYPGEKGYKKGKGKGKGKMKKGRKKGMKY